MDNSYRPWRKGMSPTQIVALEEYLASLPPCDCIAVYGCHAPDCPLILRFQEERDAAHKRGRLKGLEQAEKVCRERIEGARLDGTSGAFELGQTADAIAALAKKLESVQP